VSPKRETPGELLLIGSPISRQILSEAAPRMQATSERLNPIGRW
jgi:hypothetical protein